jgi:hypothetical protein
VPSGRSMSCVRCAAIVSCRPERGHREHRSPGRSLLRQVDCLWVPTMPSHHATCEYSWRGRRADRVCERGCRRRSWRRDRCRVVFWLRARRPAPLPRVGACGWQPRTRWRIFPAFDDLIPERLALTAVPGGCGPVRRRLRSSVGRLHAGTPHLIRRDPGFQGLWRAVEFAASSGSVLSWLKP